MTAYGLTLAALLHRGANPVTMLPPDSHRVTSQCLEIAGWSHDDCPGGYCRCACHTRQAADLAARLRTYREQQQARLDAGPLGRRGTTNRALDAWKHTTTRLGG